MAHGGDVDGPVEMVALHPELQLTRLVARIVAHFKIRDNHDLRLQHRTRCCMRRKGQSNNEEENRNQRRTEHTLEYRGSLYRACQFDTNSTQGKAAGMMEHAGGPG